MPPINHVAVTAGLAAVSVAVAAAISLYENDDVRRYTEQLRRRIAIALHNLGNELDPAQTRDLEPLFNRPEDADGFLMSSRGGVGEGEGQGGVDADAETRKRQRDELMYWNAIRESKLEAERAQNQEGAAPPAQRNRGASFDDFLQQDLSAENGTMVINTGADTQTSREGLTRRNAAAASAAAAGVAGLAAGLHANPFSDEQQIDDDDEALTRTMLAPGADEMSDIYSASTRDNYVVARQTPPASISSHPHEQALIDIQSEDTASTVSQTLDYEHEDQSVGGLGSNVPDVPHGEDRNNLFAVIGAWADATDAAGEDSHGEDPMTPTSASFSHIEGQLTPDDEFSLAGGDEDVEHPVDVEPEAASDADVQSMSEGMFTPASWSEVGSTVSESEASMRARASRE